MKRTKNIFNSLISPQNLLQSEGTKQFKIGSLAIGSNWLNEIRPNQYRQYIASALQLSQLQKELDELKEGENSPKKEANLFKIGKTKKKMDHLALQPAEEQKPLQQSLAKNQPPQTHELVVQKISEGFFTSLLQRKCKIYDKKLYIQSTKDEKIPWIEIGIAGYTIQLEQKEKLLNNEMFKKFQWIKGFTSRILISAPGNRCYCIYGKIDNLKKFQRYFQVQHIQVKQLDIFNKLDIQLKQKIITLFGSKVRFYDHSIRIRKAEKDAQIDTYIQQQNQKRSYVQRRQNTLVKEKSKQKQKQKSSDVGQQSQIGHSSDLSQSGLLQSQSNLNQEKNDNREIMASVHLDTKQQFFKGKGSKPGNEIFKLKLKSSTVFYNQIRDPIQFNDNKEFGVQDLQLNLKDEIGISDVDQESENRSGTTFKRQGSRKKVKHMTLRNVMDNSQKFDINIFEASSNHKSEKHNKSQRFQSDPLAKDDEPSSSNIVKSLRAPSTPQERGRGKLGDFIDINSKLSQDDQILDYFQLQKARPPDQGNNQDGLNNILSQKRNNALANKIGKENFSGNNFKKKKLGEIQVYQSSNIQEIYFAIPRIQMFQPYNSQKLEFQLIQIDVDLEIQGKIVSCGRAGGTLYENKQQADRYMLYTIQGGFHFRFSKKSHRFVFVLIEQSKNHYIQFQIDPNPKYQRNKSQLLVSKLNKEGYPFACCLILYTSPTPIQLKTTLKTIEFMHKYLNEGEDYNFKHDFMDEKKRFHNIKKQWNKTLVKNSVLQGDLQSFSRAVFLGLSSSIFASLKKRVKYDPKQLFSFSQNQYRMLEQNIVTGLIEIKAFLKPYTLIKLIAEDTYNQSMRERLQHVYVYFLNRYGSVRNLALIFIKQILQKLQPILLLCRRQEEVLAIFKLYFEVEYEIDELFLSMSSYFKK